MVTLNERKPCLKILKIQHLSINKRLHFVFLLMLTAHLGLQQENSGIVVMEALGRNAEQLAPRTRGFYLFIYLFKKT